MLLSYPCVELTPRASLLVSREMLTTMSGRLDQTGGPSRLVRIDREKLTEDMAGLCKTIMRWSGVLPALRVGLEPVTSEVCFEVPRKMGRRLDDGEVGSRSAFPNGSGRIVFCGC